jgi:hypothetical protein
MKERLIEFEAKVFGFIRFGFIPFSSRCLSQASKAAWAAMLQR